MRLPGKGDSGKDRLPQEQTRAEGPRGVLLPQMRLPGKGVSGKDRLPQEQL